MARHSTPTISILVPAYNERDNLPELYRQLSEVFSGLPQQMELLVIDDASTDGTLEWLRQTSCEDDRVRFVSFSRNFGHQAAVTAGLQHAIGDAVVIMDADLQDPPEVIPEMIQKWEAGAGIVTARRSHRDVDPLAKRALAWLYYRVLAHLSETKIPVDAADFCLMDRVAVDTLNRLPERNRYVRGLRAWVGFPQSEVTFVRQPRLHGAPKYDFFKSLLLAANGVVAFSLVPLRLTTYLGLVMGTFAFLLMVLVIYWRFFTNAPLAGYGILISSFLLICSVQFVILGIIGEYIGRIYEEVKGRPQYLLKEVSTRLGDALEERAANGMRRDYESVSEVSGAR